MTLKDCHTQAQAADIFTKHFVNPEQWDHAQTLIGMLGKDTAQRLLRGLVPRQEGGATAHGNAASRLEAKSKTKVAAALEAGDVGVGGPPELPIGLEI